MYIPLRLKCKDTTKKLIFLFYLHGLSLSEKVQAIYDVVKVLVIPIKKFIKKTARKRYRQSPANAKIIVSARVSL